MYDRNLPCELRKDFDFNKVAYLPLTKGKIAYFDMKFFKELSKYRWSCERVGKTYSYAHRKDNNNKTIRMHNQILKINGGGFVVDHINGDKLDNRMENLRIVTKNINSLNRKCSKGYYFDKERKSYRVRLQFNKKALFFGSYKNESDAKKIADLKRDELISKEINKINLIGKTKFFK